MNTMVWGRDNSGLGFVAGAGAIAGGGLATGTVAGASWAAIAVPIIGPALVAVTMGISAWMKRRNEQKLAATAVVNQIEPFMAQNRDAYLAGPRTRSAQTQALANFDAMWADVVSACSDPQLGNAGRACIADRQPGGQWDWASYYRDPIAHDANVVPDPVITDPVSGIFTPIVAAVNQSPYRQVLPIAGLALLVVGVAVLVGGKS